MTVTQLTRTLAAALKAEADVIVTRKGDKDGKNYTGKLVKVEPNEAGDDRFAIRSGKPGRPIIVTLAEIENVERVAA